MIFTKELKSKRILFSVLMVLEYVLLKLVLKYNIWFNVLYFIISYIIMKILYKDKTNITDVFTLGISSIFLGISSIICFLLFHKSIFITVLINRLLIFILLVLFRNKLPKLSDLYKLLWNRNDKINKPIKSTTFRALNLVIFNMYIYGINVCIFLVIILKYWR